MHTLRWTLTWLVSQRTSPTSVQIYCNYLNGNTLLQAYAIRVSSCCQLRERHGTLLSCHRLFLLKSLCLGRTNIKIRGCDDAKVLKQHKDCLQACHIGMVGSEVFSASRDKIFPSSSYHIYNCFVELAHQVLLDHNLHYTVPNGNCAFHLWSRSSRLLNPWPGVLLVCFLTLSILTLPPRSSSSRSWRR